MSLGSTVLAGHVQANSGKDTRQEDPVRPVDVDVGGHSGHQVKDSARQSGTAEGLPRDAEIAPPRAEHSAKREGISLLREATGCLPVRKRGRGQDRRRALSEFPVTRHALDGFD